MKKSPSVMSLDLQTILNQAQYAPSEERDYFLFFDVNGHIFGIQKNTFLLPSLLHQMSSVSNPKINVHHKYEQSADSG